MSHRGGVEGTWRVELLRIEYETFPQDWCFRALDFQLVACLEMLWDLLEVEPPWRKGVAGDRP